MGIHKISKEDIRSIIMRNFSLYYGQGESFATKAAKELYKKLYATKPKIHIKRRTKKSDIDMVKRLNAESEKKAAERLKTATI